MNHFPILFLLGFKVTKKLNCNPLHALENGIEKLHCPNPAIMGAIIKTLYSRICLFFMLSLLVNCAV